MVGSAAWNTGDFCNHGIGHQETANAERPHTPSLTSQSLQHSRRTTEWRGSLSWTWRSAQAKREYECLVAKWVAHCHCLPGRRAASAPSRDGLRGRKHTRQRQAHQTDYRGRRFAHEKNTPTIGSSLALLVISLYPARRIFRFSQIRGDPAQYCV